jgi:hypothetical protein
VQKHVRRDVRLASDVYQAFTLVEQRIATVKDMRSNIDVEFESWFTESKKMADQLGIDVKVPRLCRGQAHRGNVGDSSDPSDYFKANIAIPFLDYLYQELRCRFQKDDGPSYSVFSLVPNQIVKQGDSDVSRLANDLMFGGGGVRLEKCAAR